MYTKICVLFALVNKFLSTTENSYQLFTYPVFEQIQLSEIYNSEIIL